MRTAVLIAVSMLAGCAPRQPMTPEQAQAAAAILSMHPYQQPAPYVVPMPYQIPVNRGWNMRCQRIGQFTDCSGN